MKHREESLQILSQMTVEEKIALQTGQGEWTTAGVERLGIPKLVMSDGPHGLRKETVNSEGKQTQKAVCFPTASKLAASFNRSLVREVGAALGEQCRMENVDVLLGPGINIKRDPRCGRNFEYFSEDPYLSGELGAAYVKGVQSQGVGVALKHFAANSREYGRFVCDSVIDEKCLQEIYLSAFKNVIDNAEPYSVMCAYNSLNGSLCSENKRLLTDILRKEWKYDGLVVSDWHAVSDRAAGITAGLDLEMPEGDTSDVKAALGLSLEQSALDEAVLNILDITFKAKERAHRNADYEYQHVFAEKVSAECTVLLKNTCGLLPFMKMDKIAVIGALAENPHIQGEGSSRVEPFKTSNLLEGLKNIGVGCEYAAGYRVDGAEDGGLIEQAVKLASEAEKVVVVVGLTDKDECEGFDRKDLSLPSNQLKLLSAVTSANSSVAAVLMCGAPVATEWTHSVKAVVLDYLGGESEGNAMASVLFGEASPSGRLPETWPETLPKFCADYQDDMRRALYRESIFVGYRYYTTAKVRVAFPFGYGLSYTSFSYSKAALSEVETDKNGKINLSVEVKNTGAREGSEVLQLYVRNIDNRCFKADKELKGFVKLTLKSNQSKTVSVPLSIKSLATYSTSSHSFAVNGGRYEIILGKNAEEEIAVLPLYIAGDNDTEDISAAVSAYYDIDENFCPSDEQFETLYGSFPAVYDGAKRPFTLNSTFSEVSAHWLGKLVFKTVMKKMSAGAEAKRAAMAQPLRSAKALPFINTAMLKAFLVILNGNFFRGVKMFFYESRSYKRKLKKASKVNRK